MTVAVAADAVGHGGASPAGLRRFIDKGAIFGGWVGLGMGIIIAIAFELILTVQTLVFISAPLAGAIIGAYANVRSDRWRPRGRVMLNAAYAGLVTALGLAILYVLVRLLFVFADTGYPQFNRHDANGNPVGQACATGPECTYLRYVTDPVQAEKLAAAGVTDGASFGAAVIREQIGGGVSLILLTVGGALVGGGLRSLRTAPKPRELATV